MKVFLPLLFFISSFAWAAPNDSGPPLFSIGDGFGTVIGPAYSFESVYYLPVSTIAHKSPTYSASISGLTTDNISTDLLSIVGSSSKKITITKFDVSGIQTTGGQSSIQLIKRSTLDTGGGVATIVQVQSSYTTTSSTTASVTFSATGSGNLLVVCTANRDNRTVSSMTDGTNSFTQLTGTASATGAQHTDCWYLLSSTAGKTSVTATFNGTSTTKSLFFWEVSGTGIATDVGNHINNGTTSAGGTDTGATVTTTAVDFIAAVVTTAGTITSNPAPGNNFTAGGAITTGAAGASALGGATSYTPVWSDSGTLTAFGNSTAAFQIAGSTQPTVPSVPHDSGDPSATAVVKYYTQNPTLGTSVGSVRAVYLPVTSSTSTNRIVQNWSFENDDQKGIVLNNANESLNLNLSGSSISGGNFNIDIEWKEE